MNEFFHTWGSPDYVEWIEIGEQSFGYKVFIFSPMNTYVKY